jgi:acyl-[acyl-carrier-protein]-phospholipid O-acyltransferase / long-chain-fatty-acid--[acyl-carrier-protein] ligase
MAEWVPTFPAPFALGPLTVRLGKPLLFGDLAPLPVDSDSWLSTGSLIVAVVLVGVAAFTLLCWLRPLLLLRGALWLVTHTVYRIRVYGAENVPATGPALLVCNHVTFLDWLLVLAAHKRFVRFLVFVPYARSWGFRHLLHWAGAIAVDGSAGPRAVVQALRSASEALKRGELVCIFAEGKLTRNGFLLHFHRGFEQILKHAPVPVIPLCLDQVWGSVFSYKDGKVCWKWPQEIPYPVILSFGTPLPPPTEAAEVRLAIQKLSADASIRRTRVRRPVHRQFVRVAARHPFRTCYLDPGGRVPKFSYGGALAAVMCFAARLRPLLGAEPLVGVWLPASVGGALTNITLALLRKTAVNLNYTSSAASIQSAIRQCGIRQVITAQRFTSRLPLEAGPGVELIYLEDLVPTITRWARLRAYLSVLLLPGWVLEHWVLGLGSHKLDDLATVIFSSGSTGEPKGVMLTHANITANAVSMIQAIGLRKEDRVLGVLPFFHSFGYTVTLWVPLQVGASAVYYPDPRQSKEIGELCRSCHCTLYLSTPTFLRFCLRRCEPDDFRSLRLLICGAEKLPQPLAVEFQQKFGVLPLEGYGCTELAPAVAANVPDVEVNGLLQLGNKPGTIGQPLPGVAVRVVEPETRKLLPPSEGGLLLVYGGNVMKGYLGQEEKTREVVRDGWYVTGDMARIDEDGFVTITGRLSRFAKIGGEMVPLEKIEEELHAILETNDKVCAVTAVPDDKKGERVVVLHLPLGGTEPRHLSHQLACRGLPNLGLPGERDFFLVPEMPVLGSGKLDLRRVHDLAVECVRGNGS